MTNVPLEVFMDPLRVTRVPAGPLFGESEVIDVALTPTIKKARSEIFNIIER
jgi:hypothetical protein